jgi:hypothetical protein
VGNRGETYTTCNLPHDLRSLVSQCLQSRKRFIARINNKTASGRSIAKKIGIDHKTLQAFLNNPAKELSRKTMVKIARNYTREQTKIKTELHPAMNGWN